MNSAQELSDQLDRFTSTRFMSLSQSDHAVLGNAVAWLREHAKRADDHPLFQLRRNEDKEFYLVVWLASGLTVDVYLGDRGQDSITDRALEQALKEQPATTIEKVEAQRLAAENEDAWREYAAANQLRPEFNPERRQAFLAGRQSLREGGV